VAAKLIAQKRGVDPGLLEEYFAAGLLHNIGKLPLSAALPRKYPPTLKRAHSRSIPSFQSETENLGLNHNEAGELVVTAWGIKGAMADAVIHHHNYREYAGKHKELLYSIVAANYFASLAETDFAGSPGLQKPDNLVWKTLGIVRKDVENLKPIVDEAIKKAQIFLTI
jgi:HD-like signal output (HDOD) protein